MPSSRSRPWRQLAVRRAARRRSGEPVPRTAHVLPQPQPLPPLVPPDDDREFVTSLLVPALTLTPALEPEPA